MMWIRLILHVCFCLWIAPLWADTLSEDSIKTLLKLGQYDAIIRHIQDAPHPNDPENQVILMIAYYIQGDTLASMALRENLFREKMGREEAEAVMKSLFSYAFVFITNPPVYYYIEETGEQFSAIHQEPRAQFSFLQQQFSMHQMTGQVEDTRRILARMRAISKGHAYLEYLADMHLGLFYGGLQDDSCVYFFDAFLAAAPKFIGKPNPFFLHDEAYAAKKDSGVLASTIVEYAKHYIRKGDLRRAGELLVTSDRHIPDTNTFLLLKVQNQVILAMIYADLVHPEKAISYTNVAIDLCHENKLTKLRQTRVASARCYVLMTNEQYAAAFEEAQTAYNQYKGGVNAQDLKKQALKAALCKAWQNEKEEGLNWLDSANRIDCPDDQEILFLRELAAGEMATLRQAFAEGETHYAHAIDAARKTKAIGWEKMAKYRAYLSAKKSHHPQKSLALLESFTVLTDSLYRTGQDVALFDVQSAYEKTIQDETIARLDAQQAAASLQLKSHRRMLALALMGLTIVAALCIGLYKMYRRLRLVNGELSKTVQEKNILLREIHHRVKNNLQVISSLLKLQSGYIKDDSAIQAIAEGRSRVQSMALLHQNLYKEDNLTGVNMKEYFDNLIQGLFDTYNISDQRIVLHKNISALTLDVDTVVPLGLVANELISNALKHAFPAQSSGNLYVDLYEEGRQLIMKVRDDGTGLSTAREKEGFGTKLIQSLSQKLEANITTRSVHGTEVILRIKEYKKAA